jgi:hypothetical protein
LSRTSRSQQQPNKKKMGATSRLTTQQRQLKWQLNRSFEIKEAVPNKVLVFMPAANPEDSFCW